MHFICCLFVICFISGIILEYFEHVADVTCHKRSGCFACADTFECFAYALVLHLIDVLFMPHTELQKAIFCQSLGFWG